MLETYRHVVIGFGQVGVAIHALLDRHRTSSDPKIEVVDPARGLKPRKVGNAYPVVLHICYPSSDDFVAVTRAYQDYFDSDLVIVHSTVQPGTCDPNGWVHSPVSGQHPLTQSLPFFRKWVGTKIPGLIAPACEVIRDGLGLTPLPFDSATTTELAKVLDTTRLGWDVVWHKDAARLCQQYGADFTEVLTEWTEDYNEGYRRMGKPEFVRPASSRPAKPAMKPHRAYATMSVRSTLIPLTRAACGLPPRA